MDKNMHLARGVNKYAQIKRENNEATRGVSKQVAEVVHFLFLAKQIRKSTETLSSGTRKNQFLGSRTRIYRTVGINNKLVEIIIA